MQGSDTEYSNGDILRCDICGKESLSSPTRPVNAFHCSRDGCKGTMYREGHGPDYLWNDDEAES